MKTFLSFLNTFFGLSFKDIEVEKRYQKNFIAEHKEQNILVAKIAIILYFLYAPLTYILIKNEALLLLEVVLFSISGPLFLIFFAKKNLLEKYQYQILFFAALITGLGPALFYTFTTNDRATFQVDLIIPIIAIFTMYGVGFSLALLIYLSITSIFLLLAIFMGLSFIDIFMALYASIFTAIVSALSGYMIEKSTRRLFLAKMKSDEFKFIIENSHDSIAIFAPKTLKYLYANKKTLTRTNNSTLEAIIGKNIFEVNKNMSRYTIDLIIKNLDEKGFFSSVVPLEDSQGKTHYVHNVTQYGFFNSQEVIVSVSSDVTELKEAELQMREMALKDSLTQLFNRYKLNEYSMLEIERYQRERQSVSLVICDIDFFKKVNDTYGHLVGDSVLQKIATTLKESVRSTDIVARWGGEEFALLLINTEKKEAFAVAQKVNRKISEIDFEDIDQITISCGVSQLRAGDTQIRWFKRVDDALYEAKKNGRNRVIYK